MAAPLLAVVQGHEQFDYVNYVNVIKYWDCKIHVAFMIAMVIKLDCVYEFMLCYCLLNLLFLWPLPSWMVYVYLLPLFVIIL